MFTGRRLLNELHVILPALLLGAIYVLSNTTLGVCGAPGGC
jgi:hypothetical protein